MITQEREKAKLGKSKKKTKASTKKPKLRPYLTEIANYQAHANMCAGYYKLLVALREERKTLVPNPQFDNELVSLFSPSFKAYCMMFTCFIPGISSAHLCR